MMPEVRHFVAGAMVAVVCQAAGLFAQETGALPETPAERTGYLSFTSPDSVAPWLKGLSARSDSVEFEYLETDGGSVVMVPVIRIAPGSSNSRIDRVRVLIIGTEHGDERVGLEAGLRLSRDLVSGSLRGLRTWLDVRIVPVANPTGIRARQRSTTAGSDLHLDHLRHEAPETRAIWAEALDAWPHLVIDIHEIGPSEYGIQIAAPTHPAVDPAIVAFARFRLLPHAANALAGANVRFHEYVQTWQGTEALEIAASPLGVSIDGASGDVGTWFSPPSPSAHMARNAFALAGSVTLSVFASSSRDVLGLAERTDRVHAAVAAILRAAAEQSALLTATVAEARRTPEGPLPLRSGYGTPPSATGLPWIFINEKGQKALGELSPWRSELEVIAEIDPDRDWWIDALDPAPGSALEGHGFRFEEPRPVPATRLAPPPTSCAVVPPREGELTVSRVPHDQPGARLLHVLLAELAEESRSCEPEAPPVAFSSVWRARE